MMPSDEQLIVRPGMKPARSKRIRWYTDPNFRRLVRDAPDVPLLNVEIADDDGSIRLPDIPSKPSSSPAKRPDVDPDQAIVDARAASKENRRQRQPSLALPTSSAPPPAPENPAAVATTPEDRAPSDAQGQAHAAPAQAQPSETWRAKSDLDYWASQVVEGWGTFDDVLAFACQKRLARAEGAGSQEIDHALIAKKAMDDVVQAIDNYERHRKHSC